jgi:hypothetical protein
MKVIDMKKFIVVAAFSTLLFSVSGISKGLDELKPGEEKPSAEDAKEDAGNAATDAAADAKDDVENPTTEGGEKPVQVVEKSALSKKIENKLEIGSGIALVLSFSGPKGEFNAGASADLSISYNLSRPVAGFDTYATFRYAPIDVTATYNNKSYRGIIESYNFGGMGKKVVKGNMTAIATAELAYMVVWMDGIDNFPHDDSIEKNGVNVVFGGGVDWDFHEKKMHLGPRLYAGGGSFTQVQLGAQASFVF